MTIELDLPCVPDSVGKARDAVERLEATIAPKALADLRLLVSEVVTNAVRHGGLGPDATIRLRLVRKAGRLRVEVADPGRGFTPRPRDPDITRPGGWGLYLVEQLADRWGVETKGRTLVWFELAA